MRLFSLFILAVLFLFSCDQPATNSAVTSPSPPAKADSVSTSAAETAPAAAMYDTSARSVQRLKTIFHIEKRNGNGIFLQLYVYLSDTSKVEPVTAYLKTQYAGQYTQAFDVWYFDKRNFVDKYLHAVDDHSLSDAAFAALDKHMICQFSWAGSGDGTFDYNRDDDAR